MASGTSAIYSRVVALRLSQRNRTAWLLDLDLSGRVTTEFRELGDDVCERLSGVDLVSARPT